jgi:hypothetical protein
MLPLDPAIVNEGGDSLTSRLAQAVEAELRSRRAPLRIVPSEPAKLVIKVRTRHAGYWTSVRYTVRFFRDGREIGRTSGSCPDVELAKCAKQIATADLLL